MFVIRMIECQRTTSVTSLSCWDKFQSNKIWMGLLYLFQRTGWGKCQNRPFQEGMGCWSPFFEKQTTAVQKNTMVLFLPWYWPTFNAQKKNLLKKMGAGASIGKSDEGPMACTLKGLPDAIETCVFVRETWPMIVDPTGQSGRFLRYQRGSYLMAVIFFLKQKKTETHFLLNLFVTLIVLKQQIIYRRSLVDVKVLVVMYIWICCNKQL